MYTVRTMPNTWEGLNTALKGVKNIERQLAFHTWVHRNDRDEIIVRLYNTKIATFELSGCITLSSGRYHTSSDKTRLDHFLPKSWTLIQKDYKWYVIDFRGYEPKRYPWQDGMSWNAYGDLIS
jgi:hypothetical protein